MSVKIRLQRHGRAKQPYYHIVVADSRSPRDGKFIERIGSYNPNTNPATIDLDVDIALSWVEQGAQPTDTMRAILTYKGVLYRKHLARGVKKGAFGQEEADKRFAEWLEKKAGKIDEKIAKLAKDADSKLRANLEAEAAVSHKRSQDILAKRSALAAEAEAANAPAAEEAPEAAAEETSNNE